MEKSAKLGKLTLLNIILFGFIGQVAWAVENNFFNTFLFSFGGTTKDISTMVAASAVVAVVTTFVMGTLSDKLGRRKVFICAGYVAWGITVMAFAFISRENLGKLIGAGPSSAAALSATVTTVIVMDCIMTFMGSTSNDSAFNAWITDVTVPENRGVAESVLSLLPLFAMAIVTVAFGAGVSAAGYPACFIALGALVTICGVLGLFTLKDSRSGEKTKSNYFKDIVYGFRPSVVKENKNLYIALAAMAIFNCAVQVFLPYIFIYIQHFMGLDFNNLGSVLTPKVIAAAAAAVVLAVAAIVFLGKGIDKYGKSKFIFLSVILFIAGLCLTYFSRTLAPFGISALIILLGYAMLMIVLNASVRDFTPEDKAGLFQGVRMIFAVLIPMVTGPSLGAYVTNRFAPLHEAATYINDYNEVVNVPVPEIFLAAAAVGIFIIIPAIFLRKKLK